MIEIPGDDRSREIRSGFCDDVPLTVAAGDMGQEKLPYPGLASQLRRLAGCEMRKFIRHLDFFLQISRLDHQGICTLADIHKILGRTSIPDVHKARPTSLGS